MSITIPRAAKRVRSALGNESGMGLMQVMLGIVIGAIIMAAGAFSTVAVLGWSQDNAAKTTADDVRTAQDSYYTATVADSMTGGSYGTKAELAGQGLVKADDPKFETGKTENGKNYWVVVESKSGKFWVITGKDEKSVVEYDAALKATGSAALSNEAKTAVTTAHDKLAADKTY